MLTFEEFKASAVRYDHDKIPSNFSDAGQDEGEGMLVYADGTCFIILGNNMKYRLHIGNEEWQHHNREPMERILYGMWYLNEVAA